MLAQCYAGFYPLHMCAAECKELEVRQEHQDESAIQISAANPEWFPADP